MNSIILKPGREKSLKRRHPWVFDGAVKQVSGNPQSGETVEVVSSSGELLGRGAWSPGSQLCVRMWTFSDEPVDEAFLRHRISVAIGIRSAGVVGQDTTGYRLVHSESDGLPGLTVDRYGDFLVCQFSSTGIERWKPSLVGMLHELTGCRGIFERSDLAVRKKEGLANSVGLLWGEEPPDRIEIRESGRVYRIDVRNGHKTGFYLDQRDNRSLVSEWSRGRKVLDCFCYSGGFSVAALAGGASHATLLDSSGPALESARNNLEANGFPKESHEELDADVFQTLRRFGQEGRQFGLVVLDPPKFVESRGQLEKGARAYKDLNRVAFKVLEPGGALFTFSCSGHMEDGLFQKIVADAALEAGCEVRFLKWLAQAQDHPVMSSFPEGKYLKGLLAVRT